MSFCLLSEARENPDKYRFEVELEFVQCLGNPSYLNCESRRANHYKNKATTESSIPEKKSESYFHIFANLNPS